MFGNEIFLQHMFKSFSAQEVNILHCVDESRINHFYILKIV